MIVEQLGVDAEQLTSEATLVDGLDADDLDLVDLMIALEEEFGTTISDEAWSQVATVGDAITLVHSLIA